MQAKWRRQWITYVFCNITFYKIILKAQFLVAYEDASLLQGCCNSLC